MVEIPTRRAAPFTHWLAWGIEGETRGLVEGERPPLEGRNSFRQGGRRGPCPPRGHGPHRYVFRLVALDATLEDLAAGAAARGVDEAVNGHILAADELLGTFER